MLSGLMCTLACTLTLERPQHSPQIIKLICEPYHKCYNFMNDLKKNGSVIVLKMCFEETQEKGIIVKLNLYT